MAFKSVIEGKSCIVADQSGSGKTLAYLTPIIQRLRQEELQGASKSLSKCPRVVILVPTAELALQVRLLSGAFLVCCLHISNHCLLNVLAKNLCHEVKTSVVLLIFLLIICMVHIVRARFMTIM